LSLVAQLNADGLSDEGFHQIYNLRVGLPSVVGSVVDDLPDVDSKNCLALGRTLSVLTGIYNCISPTLAQRSSSHVCQRFLGFYCLAPFHLGTQREGPTR
jgi:hypothetical protein